MLPYFSITQWRELVLIFRSEYKAPFTNRAISQLCYRASCSANCFLRCTCIYRAVHKAARNGDVGLLLHYLCFLDGFLQRGRCSHSSAKKHGHLLHETCWSGCIFSALCGLTLVKQNGETWRPNAASHWCLVQVTWKEPRGLLSLQRFQPSILAWARLGAGADGGL